MSDLVIHSELISSHGSETGVFGRFFFQAQAIASMSFSKESFDSRSGNYFSKVLPEITNFYDLYHEIQLLIQDFISGTINGQYYRVDDRGSSYFDRGKELKIRQLVKDFFVRGKILLMSFAKSALLVDEENKFNFSEFYFCDVKKFNARAENYIKSSDKRYLPVINLIAKASDGFLSDFNKIRGEIEHELFSLDKFEVSSNSGQIVISEPLLNNTILSSSLDSFYNSILEFIEKSVIYFFGVTAEINTKGFISVMVRNEYSYSSSYYKYTYSTGGLVVLGGDATKCLYD